MKKRIVALMVTIVLVLGMVPVSVWAEENLNEHDGHSKEDCAVIDETTHSYYCSCGETVIESCTFTNYSYNNREHYLFCGICGQTDDSSIEPHTMVGCVCTDENCCYTNHIVETWTTNDCDTHKGFCSACQQFVEENHGWILDYSEEEHWWKCNTCDLEDEGSRERHTIASDWQDYDQNQHTKSCEGCSYYQHTEIHKDSDHDGYCDVETCGRELCVDADNDHYCDDCYVDLWRLCVDTDNNHACDICGEGMENSCFDKDNNHVCDVLSCARHMIWLCIDEDNDLQCDKCGQSICWHYLGSAKNNGDGTHTGVCLICSERVVLECYVNNSYYNHTTHTFYCLCGREMSSNAHTYQREYIVARSVSGHWIECDSCAGCHYEPHTETSGVCEDCEQVLTQVFDVYVGGVGLLNGQYLDNDGNVTATKPAGGYAYYKDGVLELNGYEYEGEGFLWIEELYDEDNIYSYYASIFSHKALVLNLFGENKLCSDEDGDGLACIGNLTVKGDGSLKIRASDDGIHVKNGDFLLESGTLILGVWEYNENAFLMGNEWIGDDGIDVDAGNLTIKGGTLSIRADDHGIDVSGTVTICGGTVNIVACDDGFEVDNGIVISGGTIFIVVSDNDGIQSKKCDRIGWQYPYYGERKRHLCMRLDNFGR